MTDKEKLELIIKSLDAKRGEDIQAIKIGDLTILADYFVIVNGTSNTHTRTLADEVEFLGGRTEGGENPPKPTDSNGSADLEPIDDDSLPF